jgi:spore coat protein CotH
MPVSPLLVAVALAAAPDPAAELFAHKGPVPVVRITVDKENLTLLRREPRKYVRCTVRVGDQTYRDVGIHIKGAAGSTRDWDDKPALTLNMDKFARGQTFRGLDKWHLNNSVQDGSALNEILANELAAAIGLPHCRCTHALVELNGRKVGLYVLKEGFDKKWLSRHFKDTTGNLYDGGFCQDIDAPLKLDLGRDVGHKDLQQLAKACRDGSRQKQYEAVSKLVDVDKFAAMTALQIVTSDWDGYTRKANNYRLYFEPNGKAVFVPHGMDQMWQNPHESLWPGCDSTVGRVILNNPEGKKLAIAKLKELADQHFTVEKMHARIDLLVPRAREALVAAGRRDWADWFAGESRGLKDRIRQRVEYMKRELPRLK